MRHNMFFCSLVNEAFSQESSTVFENPQKVSFIIASEASYVYIFGGQKFIKNAKNGHFW